MFLDHRRKMTVKEDSVQSIVHEQRIAIAHVLVEAGIMMMEKAD